MARIANDEQVRRALAAVSLLRTEPGWHDLAEVATSVGARPARLADDLRRLAYSAGYATSPIAFGDDVEPSHASGASVVRYLHEAAVDLPLPASRIELTRAALLAEAAIGVDPLGERAERLRALRDRIVSELTAGEGWDATRLHDIPDNVSILHAAIDDDVTVSFAYRGLADVEASDRHVTPNRVWRVGSGWVMAATTVDEGAGRTYRIDRIVGGVTVHPPTNATTQHPAPQAESSRINVRIRIGDDELWAVEAYDPIDLTPVTPDPVGGGGEVEVTIHLYPPADMRLARLLMLLRPTAVVLEPTESDALLGAYRAQVAEQSSRHGVG